MKTADVKIGEVYLTKIGDVLVRVIPTVKKMGLVTSANHNQRVQFICKREDNGHVLPKARTAAALRPAPAPAKVFNVRVNDAAGELLFSGRSTLPIDDVANVAVRQPKIKARFGDGLKASPTVNGQYVLRGESTGAVYGYIHISERS